MEITEQRRLKDIAPDKEIEPKTKASPNDGPAPVIEELKPPIKEEKTEAIKNEVQIPAKTIAGVIILIFLIIAFFLIVSSKNSGPWMDPLIARLNALIVFGAFCVLNILQGASIAQGVILKTHYYMLSLQGDMVALYSLELLIAFAALFIFFHRAEWNKWSKVFMALVPLAVIANILRLVLAFGYALNYGTGIADRYFHGILVGIVFIIILLGLVFFEYLTSSE